MPAPDLAITSAIVCDLVRQLCGISKENEAQIQALKSDLASLRAVIAPAVAATPLPPPPAASTTAAAASTDQITEGGRNTLPTVPSDLTAAASTNASTIIQDEAHTNATTTAAPSASPSATGSPTVLLRDGPLSLDQPVADLPAISKTSKASAEASTETSTADFITSTAVQTSPKDDRATNNDTAPPLITKPIGAAAPSTTTTGSQSDSLSAAVSASALGVKETAVQTRNMPDPQIAALKKDNAALMSTLKEYESTLELIMTKFRSYALSTQNEKKLLSQDHAKQLDQERLQAQSYAVTNVQLAEQLERAHAAIRASLQASAEEDKLILQELAATQAEAKTLREVVAVHEETTKFYKQVDRFLADQAAAKPREEAASQHLPVGGGKDLVSPKDDQPLESSALPNPHSPPTYPRGKTGDVASTPLASAMLAPEVPSSPPTTNADTVVDADPTPVLSPHDLFVPEPQTLLSGAPVEDKPVSEPALSQATALGPPAPPPTAALPPAPTAVNPLIGAGTGSSSLSMSRSTSNPFLQSTLAAPASGTPPLGINLLLGPIAAPSFTNTVTTDNSAAAPVDQVAADWGDWSDDLGVPLDTGATADKSE